MSKVLESFETTAGKTYKKIEDSLGRTQYRAEGEQGAISQNKFAAAKSHTPEKEIVSRGNQGGLENLESLDQLGGEYTAELTRNVNQYERGSDARKKAADVNRWLGFKHSNETPDDEIEAAKQYAEMKDRLEDATTPEEEQDIKRDYNIGGS